MSFPPAVRLSGAWPKAARASTASSSLLFSAAPMQVSSMTAAYCNWHTPGLSFLVWLLEDKRYLCLASQKLVWSSHSNKILSTKIKFSLSSKKNSAQHCRHLTHLEVMHGPDFDKDTVEHLCSNGGLPSLRMLILNFTPASRVALEFLLGNLSPDKDESKTGVSSELLWEHALY